MKRLIIVGNPFQLMLALFFYYKVFSADDDIDVLIFKSVIGHETFANKLMELSLFRRVILLEEASPRGNWLGKTIEVIHVAVGNAEKISYITDSCLANSDYDEVWYYNWCRWYYGIYDVILKHEGKCTNYIAYMESVFTYTLLRQNEIQPIFSQRDKVIRFGRKCLNKWIFDPYMGDVFIQYPGMADEIDGRYLHQLPVLSEADIDYLRTVQEVFSTPKFSKLPKYIFMASSLEFDGFGTGETDLIIRIAEIVGKENLIVKLHPRDNRGVIEKAGIRVMESSNVCWEAIQLTNDFSENVFLTVASASIVNAILFSEQEVKAYYLFPLIKKMSRGFMQYCMDSVNKTIQTAHDNGIAKDIAVLDSFEALNKVLVQ